MLSTPNDVRPLSLTEAMHRFSWDKSDHPPVWITGEISDLRRARSGHRYFTLSDGAAQIPCVLWKGVARQITPAAENGIEVTVYGWIQPCPGKSHMEFDVRDLIVRRSLGPRRLAYETLEARLRSEGLLDPQRKRALPQAPTCIGIVTSPAGDVVHDIRRVLQRRGSDLRIEIAPTRVSGEQAAEEMAAAIRSMSNAGAVNLVILARGGGSTADLAAFNTEMVARAIAECRVPVITAIGHEPTVTIADLVADVRCATPSEAAETAAQGVSRAATETSVSGAELQLQFGTITVSVRLPFVADVQTATKS